MQPKSGLIVPAACLFTAAVLTSSPALASGLAPVRLPVPPASFLNYHAATVHELSQEVSLDSVVRRRLASHFHVSEAQITTYVRQNLVLTHLKKAGKYRVACVARNGREYWIESRLPAGTAVFASRATGRPMLKLACGNPMVSSLTPTHKMAEGLEDQKQGPPQFALLSAPPAVNSPKPGLLRTDFSPDDLMVASSDILPAVVQVSPSFEGFTPTGGGLNPGTLLTHSGGAFNFFPALVGVAALSIAGNHSSGHSQEIPSPTPAAVPETSTLVSLGLMLGIGAVGVITRRKRVMTPGN